MHDLLATNGKYGLAGRLKHASLAAVVAVSAVGTAAAPLFLSSTASAQAKASATTNSTVTVTAGSLQGWTNASSGSSAKVDYVADATAPLGKGALQLSTPANGDEAEFDRNVTPTLLSSLKNFGYDAKKAAGDPSYVAPAYVLGVDLSGTATTTDKDFYAFFEPVYNNVSDLSSWQHFTIDPAASKFWSFSPLGTTGLGGANGANLFTLKDLATAFPTAKVNELTLNLGSGTPGWAAEADNITLGNTTWNVEPTLTPGSRDDCKNTGWQTFNTPVFRNQGQCVSYVERNSHEVNGNIAYTAANLKRQAWFHMDTADNRGWFVYADANHDWYGVKVTSVKVEGNSAWFAGQVDRSKDGKFNGNWLLAKVTDGKPDQIWGTFTDQTTAQNGVQAKTDPAGGAFTVTRGNLKITREDD